MSVLFVYFAGFVFIGFFAVLFYVLSVQSRKSYTCPQCGERLQTEHLDASHCNLCGAPLNPAHRD